MRAQALKRGSWVSRIPLSAYQKVVGCRAGRRLPYSFLSLPVPSSPLAPCLRSLLMEQNVYRPLLPRPRVVSSNQPVNETIAPSVHTQRTSASLSRTCLIPSARCAKSRDAMPVCERVRRGRKVRRRGPRESDEDRGIERGAMQGGDSWEKGEDSARAVGGRSILREVAATPGFIDIWLRLTKRHLVRSRRKRKRKGREELGRSAGRVNSATFVRSGFPELLGAFVFLVLLLEGVVYFGRLSLLAERTNGKEGREGRNGREARSVAGREGGSAEREGKVKNRQTMIQRLQCFSSCLLSTSQPATQPSSQAATEPPTIALPCHTGCLAGPPACVLMRFFLPARAAA